MLSSIMQGDAVLRSDLAFIVTAPGDLVA